MFEDLQIETRRVIMRQFTMADAYPLHEIVSRQDVMRFLPEGTMSLEEVRRTLTWLSNCYAKNAPGRIVKLSLAVDLRNTCELIGWAGLGPLDFATEKTEVFFGLSPAHWGEGLATEAAKAVLGFGLGPAGLKRIVAVVNPENTASVRVIEKIGMEYEREVTGLPPEHSHYEGARLYSITGPDRRPHAGIHLSGA
jgi:ribosomal-protein-alanine N-acetyltransferase